MKGRSMSVALLWLTLPVLFEVTAAPVIAAEGTERVALTYEQTEDRSKFISQVRKARQGDVESQWQVGATYVSLGDPARAFHMLNPAAEAGHTRAATLLGRLHESGRGTEKSLDEANRWYGIAAKRGDAEAIAALGRLLHKVPEMRGEARRLLQKAAELDDRDGQYHLGWMLMDPAAESRDAAQAYGWFLKAAHQGHIGAQVAVAMHLLTGAGVDADRRAAGEWLVRAAKTQDPVAHYLLGRFREEGDGEKADPDGALRSFRLAALAGHREAQFALANLLAKSHAESDRKEALEWFAKADEAGHKGAANRLGELHRDWAADLHQLTRARSIFQRAAEQGNLDSMFNLAKMLHEGLGGLRDTGKALEWFARASDGGHEKASEVLGSLLNSSVKTSSLGLKGFWQ
jgi:TPR repeat protein